MGMENVTVQYNSMFLHETHKISMFRIKQLPLNYYLR